MSNIKKMDSKIWKEWRNIGLSIEEKLTLVYLLTSTDSNITGIFKLDYVNAEKELGMSDKLLEKTLHKLMNRKLIMLDISTGEVAIPYALTFIDRSGKPVFDAITSCIHTIESEQLIRFSVAMLDDKKLPNVLVAVLVLNFGYNINSFTHNKDLTMEKVRKIAGIKEEKVNVAITDS